MNTKNTAIITSERTDNGAADAVLPQETGQLSSTPSLPEAIKKLDLQLSRLSQPHEQTPLESEHAMP